MLLSLKVYIKGKSWDFNGQNKTKTVNQGRKIIGVSVINQYSDSTLLITSQVFALALMEWGKRDQPSSTSARLRLATW